MHFMIVRFSQGVFDFKELIQVIQVANKWTQKSLFPRSLS
jgi:hypothetical protein